jgi:hypothetical protein
MFDLITRKVQHAPRHQAVSVLVSIATQVSIAGAILAGTSPCEVFHGGLQAQSCT